MIEGYCAVLCESHNLLFAQARNMGGGTEFAVRLWCWLGIPPLLSPPPQQQCHGAITGDPARRDEGSDGGYLLGWWGRGGGG